MLDTFIHTIQLESEAVSGENKHITRTYADKVTTEMFSYLAILVFPKIVVGISHLHPK